MGFEQITKNLFPKGAAWSFTKDFTLLLNAIGKNYEQIVASGESAAFITDAFKTTLLDEMLFEYGISKNDLLDEKTQRDRLFAIQTALGAQGPDYLQDRLQAAGFNLYVHQVSVVGTPAAIFGEPEAVFGEPDFVFGDAARVFSPSELLAVGYYLIFGEPEAVFGEPGMIFGQRGGDLIVNGSEYDDMIDIDLVPNNYNHFIFYIGGPFFGEFAQVPSSREDELERLILKYKPLHSWAGLFVNYV